MHQAGHFYHVYNRGCNREGIFANDGNYTFLLKRAKEMLTDYPLNVIAYCLMLNHYHFLLRPEEDDALSKFSNVYSIATPKPSTNNKNVVAHYLKGARRAN